MYNPNPNLPIFSIAFLFVTRKRIAAIDQTQQHESSDQSLHFLIIMTLYSNFNRSESLNRKLTLSNDTNEYVYLAIIISAREGSAVAQW